MKLPFSFGKKETKNYFLALLLQDEKVGSVVFEESGGKIHVVSRAEEHFAASLEHATFEEWLDNIDKVVSVAESSLPEGIHLQKTVFGVKQDWIEEGKLTAGHGRALLAVPDSQLRMRYAQRAARGGLTVRQIERLASRRSRGAHTPPEIHLDANIRSALDELQRHLGTRVLLHQKTKIRPGQLVLEYYDDAQLMGLYDRLMK